MSQDYSLPDGQASDVFMHPNGLSTERNMVEAIMLKLGLDVNDWRLRDKLIVAASPWIDYEREHS